MIAPLSVRRSPVHGVLERLNPTWGSIHGMAVSLRFRDSALESKFRQELALCDISCFPKLGVKGSEAVSWLEQTGIPVPEPVYQYASFADGSMAIRTDRHEVLLVDGPFSQWVAEIERRLQSHPPNVYLIRRQDAAFCLSGLKASAVLRETCGFDFSNPGKAVVMTRVAGVSCLILPLEIGGIPSFRIWLDSTYGVYLWEALIEIVRDHGGDAIGLDALFPLPV